MIKTWRALSDSTWRYYLFRKICGYFLFHNTRGYYFFHKIVSCISGYNLNGALVLKEHKLLPFLKNNKIIEENRPIFDKSWF